MTGQQLRTVQRNQPRRIKPFCLRNNSDMRRERGMCPSRTNRGTAAFVAVAARIRPHRGCGGVPSGQLLSARHVMLMTVGHVGNAYRGQRLAQAMRPRLLHGTGSRKRGADPGKQNQHQQVGGKTTHFIEYGWGNPLTNRSRLMSGTPYAPGSIGQIPSSHNPLG